MLVRSVNTVAWDPVISSFYLSNIPRKTRKRSRCCFTMQFNLRGRKVLLSSTSHGEVLLMGGFLVFVWASLDFSDGQRVCLDSLEYDGKFLRGVADQTKTSSQGTPFALISSGFLSHGTHSWLLKFLLVLDSAINKHYELFPDIPVPSSIIIQMLSCLEPITALTFTSELALKHRALKRMGV